MTGVYQFELGAPVPVPRSGAGYAFDANGELLVARTAGVRGPWRASRSILRSYRPNPESDEDYALLPLR